MKITFSMINKISW